MKTNVIEVTNSGKGTEEALREAERFAEYLHFSPKETLHIRLLAEEMLGMVRGIVGDFTASFWAEGEGREATLCLEAKTRIDYEQREQLLAASTSGKNYAQRTFMGKVAGVLEYCMGGYETDQAIDFAYMDYMTSMSAGYDFDRLWMLSTMRQDLIQNIAEPQKKAEWDELEKSIVAKLADEVIVGVKERKVQVIIKKRFA